MPKLDYSQTGKDINDIKCTLKTTRVLHQNIAGLYAKLDTLELALQELADQNRDVDILCFSETFIPRGSEFNIKFNNFKLASAYCRDSKRGGTCILVNKHFVTKNIQYASDMSVKLRFECCGVEIVGMNLVVLCIYRIPEQTRSYIYTFLYNLEKLLNYVTEKYKRKKVVICGDWNIDLMKPNSFTRDLLDTLESYNFQAHIQLPTRQHSSIDQIASNIINADRNYSLGPFRP